MAYRLAAQHTATFYGQLAVAKISSNPVLHVNAVASEASPVERAAFEADDRVKAVRLLADFGDRATMRLFALSIATDPPEPKRLQMLAQLMGASGDLRQVRDREHLMLLGHAAKRVTDLEAHAAWCRGLLARGVYPPASQFEAWFPSLAHTPDHVARTVDAAAS